jgi:hypothetical protein
MSGCPAQKPLSGGNRSQVFPRNTLVCKQTSVSRREYSSLFYHLPDVRFLAVKKATQSAINFGISEV